MEIRRKEEEEEKDVMKEKLRYLVEDEDHVLRLPSGLEVLLQAPAPAPPDRHGRSC